MKKNILRLTILFFILTILLLPLLAQAGRYPVRAVKAIVPYGAGGSTDVVFRAIVADAEKYLGKSIAIVNKKGGGGSVGGNYVAKAKPDGYTILLAPTSVVNIYPSLATEPAYRLGDLVPLCVVTIDPRVCVVRAELPWKSVKEMVEDSKKNPETVRFGSPGVTSWGAFGYYALEDLAGAKFLKVPLRGHSDIVAAMLRGDVDVASGTFAGYKAQVDAGKFRPIGISAEKRSEFLPNVPTYKEQGINMPTDPNVRYVWVQKGVPEEAKAKLEASFKGMCEDALVKKRIRTLNQNLEFHGRDEAWKIAQGETEYFRKLIKQFGLKIKKKK